MSADEYLECPICGGRSEKLRDGYAKFYGKVTAIEYEKLKEEYDQRDRASVAVYREIFLNPDLTITLSLSAECGTCKAKWQYSGLVNT